MKKYIAIYTALLFLPFFSFSQSTNISTAFHGNVKKADIYFNHYAYRNALTLYQHALDRDSSNVYIRERIAMCYFKLHDPVNAEYWYSSIIKDPAIHAAAKFEYAEALSMNAKYEDSKYWFQEYLKSNPNDNMAREKVAFLNNLKSYLNDSLRFILTGVNFNSTHSDYGAHYFHEGVAFASSRDVDQFFKHKAFDGVDIDESLLNMYYVKGKAQGDHEEPQHLHREHIKSFFHEGPMAFYKNDTRAVYARTNLKNGKPVYDENKKAHLQIYFSDVDKLGSMSNIVAFDHNNSAYSLAHPTVSRDGNTIYFTSTSPEGFGGSDIYFSTIVNGKWTAPENVGAGINTKGDESFPFLANDSTLYFSSNGHGTLGGLDILISYKDDGKFKKGVNFGGPLNSRFDDFSLVADSIGRVGYIASNRPGGMGLDDIYYYIATNFFLNGRLLTYGKTGDPIEDATVYAIDTKTGEILDSDITNSDGIYGLSLPFDRDYKLVVKKEGYDMLKDVNFSTQGRPMGMDSLNFALWKRDLFAKGKIYSNETQQPLTGVTVKLFDLTKNKLDTLVVSDISEYTLPLFPNRKYKVEFSKPDHITAELTLDTEGQFKGNILNDVVLVQESIDNAIINFDYDKSIITEASIALMKPLVITLKKFPMAMLNIGAHADSRGSIPYNQRLSDDRARNTVKYFVSQGISRKRITSRGFGEALLLNRCTDEATCEEVEHTPNRRAEIKVQREKK